MTRRSPTQDAHRRKILGPTKTSRTRAIPLGPRAIRALQQRRVSSSKVAPQTGDLYHDVGLIFSDEFGGLVEAQNPLSSRFSVSWLHLNFETSEEADGVVVEGAIQVLFRY